jgi:penicillin G amidase
LYIPELNSTVRILKEKDTGIAHIYADDEDSALFGLGFTHASERLWQLTYMSLLATGRLSEILGEKALPIDKGIRNFGLPHFS